MEQFSALNSPLKAGEKQQPLVLLIDSDENFRNALAENFRDDGCAVQEYTRPEDTPPVAALGQVNAVVLAHQNSQQDNLTFAEEFHSYFPEVPIVLVTTCWARNAVSEMRQRDFLCVRTKPVDYDDLHTLLLQEQQA